MVMAYRDKIISLLRGRSADGGRIAVGQIRAIARDALKRSGADFGWDPRYLALALGYRVRAVTNEGQTSVADHLIAYRWVSNARECGLSVFLGLAAALFAEKSAHPDSRDLYRLAGWLALPEDARTVDASDVGSLQPHAPIWFLEAHLRDFSGSGVRHLPALFRAI